MKTLFTKPIVIQLLPSPLLLGLLLAVASISSLVLLVIAIDLWIKLILFLVINLSTAYFMGRDALLTLPWSWQSVVVDGKGTMTLTNKRHKFIDPPLACTTFIHEYLTILNFTIKISLSAGDSVISTTSPEKTASADENAP